MKLELNEREKKMLTILGIFVLVVCIGYWGVLPNIKSASEYSDKWDEAKQLQDVNQTKISQLMTVESANEDLEKLIADSKKDFYPIMESDEIGNYVTDMVIDKYGMSIYDLTIGSRELAEIAEYRYSEKALTGKSEAVENAINAAAPVVNDDGMVLFNDAIDTSVPVTGVYRVPVSVRIIGSDESIAGLLDDLAFLDKKLRLTDYSVVLETDEVEQPDGTVQILETRTLRVSFEIYMCEP